MDGIRAGGRGPLEGELVESPRVGESCFQERGEVGLGEGGGREEGSGVGLQRDGAPGKKRLLGNVWVVHSVHKLDGGLTSAR